MERNIDQMISAEKAKFYASDELRRSYSTLAVLECMDCFLVNKDYFETPQNESLYIVRFKAELPEGCISVSDDYTIAVRVGAVSGLAFVVPQM